MAAQKPTLLFVYDIEDENLWKDGLFAAINLLKEDFEIIPNNLSHLPPKSKDKKKEILFILGWGAFNSPVDNWLQSFKKKYPQSKIGLCIAGNVTPPTGMENYDVLFYETEWYKPQISSHKNIVHAFGVNIDIFKPLTISYITGSGDPVVEYYPKLWDYLTVGAFAYWKRQDRICAKFGPKMAVGQIQRENLSESIDIIGNLLLGHSGVSDSIIPEQLAKFYNASNIVYIPADINGGGERAVLEARACGIKVEVENDNPKLLELLTSPIWDHHYYYSQLKKGIESCLN